MIRFEKAFLIEILVDEGAYDLSHIIGPNCRQYTDVAFRSCVISNEGDICNRNS